jgi:hypothetical protein
LFLKGDKLNYNKYFWIKQKKLRAKKPDSRVGANHDSHGRCGCWRLTSLKKKDLSLHFVVEIEILRL